MTRTTGTLTIVLAATLFASTLMAVPLSVLNDPNWDHRNDGRESMTLSVTPEEAEVAQFHSGDTGRYLCERKLFQYSSVAGTDCWGYRAPNGDEYAIFGVNGGIAVVNTQTLTAYPTITGPISGCGSVQWRDMKSYGQYVYAVSECSGTNGGLMVINMGNLPTSVSLVGSFPVNGISAQTSHNLSIDTIKGYAYVEGTNTPGQSIYIHNLANPAAPAFVSSFGGFATGIHDIYAYNDTVYVAEGWDGTVAVYDAANKMSPALITRWSVPNPGYVHNIWPSPDHQYCATTEETANKTIKIWDISDLQNVQLIGEVLAPSHLAHNAHWKDDKLYMSHYESGMVIIDVSNPSSPTVDLSYDTYGLETSNFNGCWGAYPFTSNGDIYASNLDGKMYILQERLDIFADTLWADSTAITQAGTQVEVTIYATNSIPAHKFQIPISWSGPSGMTLAGTSRAGTRTNYFQSETYPALDLGSNRFVISLLSSSNGTAPDLAPGSGPILKVTFDVPSGVSGDENIISFTPYVGVETYDPSFVSTCVAVIPDTAQGLVSIEGCCAGLRDNPDGIGNANILDVNHLVSYLFAAGPPPPCPEEADIDGSLSYNILDVNRLVGYLFAAGVAPAACP